GELMDGELMDGELMDGELMDGELMDGELMDGELMDGELTTSHENGVTAAGAAGNQKILLIPALPMQPCRQTRESP
ncbi:MAG TPA: hypothetical protein PKM00_04020, partial [Prolixibacteraceae bacterium]|nr:hypothetical protein [Prolixibacteraceae bacterium]